AKKRPASSVQRPASSVQRLALIQPSPLSFFSRLAFKALMQPQVLARMLAQLPFEKIIGNLSVGLITRPRNWQGIVDADVVTGIIFAAEISDGQHHGVAGFHDA